MATISPTQFRLTSATRSQNEQGVDFAYISGLAKRPIEWLRATCWGSSRPSTVLDNISSIAREGLKRANNAGIRYENRGTQLNGEIESALKSRGIGVPTARIAEVGAPADLGPNADPEITLPLRMQDQTELLTNWEERQDELLSRLLDKLSVLTALIQMRNRAGIKENNNLKILALVKQATEGPNQISVWELFTKNYELTFFQTLLAGWFYWVYYMTSLINNTINAYVTAFISNITKKLTTESDQTRQVFFERLIKNASDFLNKDRIATEKYAYDKEPDLEKVRSVAIQEEYGDLGKLCQDFSVSMIQNDPPPVRVLRSLREIYVIGHVFAFLEWFVNRFIIQRAMMYSILPDVVQGGVEKGLESIEGNPFAIAMTEFFTQQLEKFKEKLASDQPMESDSTPLPGTEGLSKVIRLLLQVLDLEGNLTARELRRKIERSANGDGPVVKQVQEGIVTGVNALFSFLNESMQSGEFMTNLLELSLLPFEGGEKDPAALTAAYEAQCVQFKKTARSTLQLLIQKAISGPGSGDQQRYGAATESMDAQKVVLNVLVPKLSEICERIEGKLASSQSGSIETNSIQEDLAQLFQVLQVLSARKELQDELEKLDGTHRNEIFRRLVPLHKRAKKIVEWLLPLQEHQNSHLRNTSTVTHLTQAKAFLRRGAPGQSRHLQTPSIPLLESAGGELTKALGMDAPVPVKFKERVQNLDTLAQAVAQEQTVLDAICALFPPRASSQDGNGLLDQMLRFQRGEKLPGFSPKDCMTRIAKNLDFFPKDDEAQAEKRELEAIIRDGTHLQDRWDQLCLTLQSIYARHFDLKNSKQTGLNEALAETDDWIDKKIAFYQSRKDQDHQKMREVFTKVVSETASLRSGSTQLGGSLSRPLSKWIWTIIPAGLVAYAGWPGRGAIIAGGLFNKMWHNPSDTSEEFGWSTFGQKLVQALVPVAIKGYTMWDPSLIVEETTTQGLNALLGAAGGYSAYSTYRSGQETYAFNQVWDIFEKAYDFSLDQRVYRAGTTRLMKEMIRSHSLATAGA